MLSSSAVNHLIASSSEVSMPGRRRTSLIDRTLEEFRAKVLRQLPDLERLVRGGEPRNLFDEMRLSNHRFFEGLYVDLLTELLAARRRLQRRRTPIRRRARRNAPEPR